MKPSPSATGIITSTRRSSSRPLCARGANAIHPGYGFLSENADFARQVEAAGLIFIGPRPETLALMGDKLAARQAATPGRPAGLYPARMTPLPPQVPLEMARSVHYPVLVKAVAGGGGRGIRLALSPKDLAQMVSAARQEALAAFGDDTVYLESLVQDARHIEVQILGDGHGHVIDLGERECSIQRRRQKLIEEAPAPLIDEDLRRRLCELARRLGRQLKYRGLGTIEFLLDRGGQYYFIEANPRIQVEHPVTEMVTGLDLVKEQLSLACGEPLRLRQHDIITRGHAIEARMLAEDCQNGFMPVAGASPISERTRRPGRAGRQRPLPRRDRRHRIRLDARQGDHLGREPAGPPSSACAAPCSEYQVGGIPTDLEFLLQIIDSPKFMSGEVTTTYLETFQPKPASTEPALERDLAWAAAFFAHQQRGGNVLPEISQASSNWQMIAWKEQMNRN